MGKITDIPTSVPTGGQGHIYPNPPPLNRVTLVSAPLDPDSPHRGLNRAAYDAYVNAELAAGRANDNSGINMLNPEYTYRVELSFDAASHYNYGRVTIEGRSWFVYYTARYVNDKVTDMVPELDEWASFDWSLGYSMIRRGHVGVAVSQGDTYGDLYCTTPEPIEAAPIRGVLAAELLNSTPGDWTVLVICANDMRGATTGQPFFEPHVNNIDIAGAAGFATDATAAKTGGPQVDVGELNYPWLAAGGGTATFSLYVPHVVASPLSTIDGVAAGGGVYAFTMAGFSAYMNIMQGASWVLNGIVDIRLVPSWAVAGGGAGSYPAAPPPTSPTSPAWATAAAIPQYVQAVVSGTTSGTVLTGWRDTLLATLGATRYRKLVTSQFSSILVTNGAGGEQFAPDQWKSGSIGFAAATGAAHGEASIRVVPDYNQLGYSRSFDVPVGGSAGVTQSGYSKAAANTASTDMAAWNSAFNSYTTRLVLLDQQALAQELAITGNQMSLGTQGAQTIINAVADMATPSKGSAIGALSGAASYAVSAVSANNSIDLLDISQDGSFDIATYQLGLSGVTTQKTFDAWAQTLRSVSGTGMGESLASAWRTLLGRALQVVITAPAIERVRAAVAMFDRYGYMIGRAFTPSRLDVMAKFSYWETEGAVVLGDLPRTRRAGIVARLDAGVTVWNQIADIGTDQTGANTPVVGSYY